MASSASFVGKIYKAYMTAEQPFKYSADPGTPGFAHRLEIQQLSCLWQGRRVPVEDVADWLVGVVAHCEANQDEHGLRVATAELEYMSRTMQRGHFVRGTGFDPLATLWSTLAWSFRPTSRHRGFLLHGPVRAAETYVDDYACAFEIAMSTLLRSWLAAHSWLPIHSSNSFVVVDTPYFQRGLSYRRMKLEIDTDTTLTNGPTDLAELQPGPFYGCTASFRVPRWSWRCWSFIDSNDPLEHLLHLAALPTLEAWPRSMETGVDDGWYMMTIPDVDPATVMGGYLAREIPQLVQEAVRQRLPWVIVPADPRGRDDVWAVYRYERPLDYWSGR